MNYIILPFQLYEDFIMSFIPGEKYPVALLLFDSMLPSDENYFNYARSCVQTCLSRLDPVFNGDSEILSGDLLPKGSRVLADMIKDPSIDIDLSRLNAPVIKELIEGRCKTTVYYMIGICFVIPTGVDMIHSALIEARTESYLGLFTVSITAGSNDIHHLKLGLALESSRIGYRL